MRAEQSRAAVGAPARASRDGTAAVATSSGRCAVSRGTIPAGVEVRSYTRRDGTVTESFTVRFKGPDGRRRRRSFDTLDDALDFRAKHRSARRWRPEELRQEHAGNETLGEFFERWWIERALVELRRSTLAVYRCLWEAHAEPRLGAYLMRDIDARCVVAFHGELLAAGVGPQSVVKTMATLQRVFRDAVEYGEVPFNSFKVVAKPSPGPTREAHPLTPLQVELLAHDLERRDHPASAALVRLMAYTGLRPQETLALHWYAIRAQTLLVELANADGQFERLKNRKRSRKRSRTVDLMEPVRRDLEAWRTRSRDAADQDLVFPHALHGGLWLDEQYRTWRRRIYVPSAKAVKLSSTRPYDLRHTWASLRIAEKRLSIAEIAEQLGDKTSTVLDTYTHVMNEWRGRRRLNIEQEIRRARQRVA
jgi:integrase